MLTDMELLNRYRLHRDEAAFTEIVRRYLGMVLRVAQGLLREERHLAPDIAQSVFLDLARKVDSVEQRCGDDRPLVGWLYKGTFYAAARVSRSEQRRHFHEAMASAQAGPLVSNPTRPNWEEIQPLLCDALDILDDTERDAILLRFFSDRSLREVGAAIGVSEEAARKRVDRGLDRLREWLHRRGIQTTSAFLASTLSLQASAQPPAALVDGVARSVLDLAGAPGKIAPIRHVPPPRMGAIAVSALVGVFLVALIVWFEFETATWTTRQTISPAPEPSKEGAIQPKRNGAGNAAPLVHLTTEPHVRVPKEMLKRLDIQTLVMTNGEARQFALSDRFVRVFSVSLSEAERIEHFVAEALHDWRIQEQKHLEFIRADSLRGVSYEGVKVYERMSFRLNPFPVEAQGITDELRRRVTTVLGEERAEWFKFYNWMFSGELRTFQATNSSGQSRSRQDVYYYRRVESVVGAVVDLEKFYSGDGGGGGVSGTYFEPDLDAYAPKELQRVLGRWRSLCEQRNQEAIAGGAQLLPRTRNRSADFYQPRTSDSSQTREAGKLWEENSGSIELPIGLLGNLGIAGLNDDGTVSSDARTLCGLTQTDVEFVEQTYMRFRDEVIQLEKDHFAAHPQDPGRFILNAFPQEMAALRAHWRRELEQRFGTDIAVLLDRLIRTQLSGFARFRPGSFVLPNAEEPVGWLGLGDEDWVVTVGPGFKFYYRSNQNEEHTGGFEDSSGRTVPLRWRHLIDWARMASN